MKKLTKQQILYSILFIIAAILTVLTCVSLIYNLITVSFDALYKYIDLKLNTTKIIITICLNIFCLFFLLYFLVFNIVLCIRLINKRTQLKRKVVNFFEAFNIILLVLFLIVSVHIMYQLILNLGNLKLVALNYIPLVFALLQVLIYNFLFNRLKNYIINPPDPNG